VLALVPLGVVAPAAGAVSDRPPVLDRLSLEQLAGQRVIYSYHGLTPPQALFDQIEQGEAAGVIFFGENVQSNAQIRRVTRQLQKARRLSPVRQPLLLMTDQEGGVVKRIPGAPVLSAKQMGAAPNTVRRAQHGGDGAGSNLAAAGVNLNLAPVLDVYRQEGNFIDRFGRSFSMDPQVVSDDGAAFLSFLQGRGVAATSKHFPGLGAATREQDTDAGPVTIDLPLDTLRTVDEYPYIAAIAAGTQLVMPSWAIYPALDPVRPAGLSHTILREELRQRLGFEGVTVTDGLEAGALNPIPIPERGVLAAHAGNDLLLFSSRDVDDGIGGLNALANAVATGRIKRAHYENAVKRVLALRGRLKANPRPPLLAP
jgi:beta-N-acetylhexosaminidase